MAVERENFKFSIQDFGVKSTNKVIDRGEAFLNSDPDDIQLADKDEDEEDEAISKRKDKDKDADSKTLGQQRQKPVTKDANGKEPDIRYTEGRLEEKKQPMSEDELYEGFEEKEGEAKPKPGFGEQGDEEEDAIVPKKKVDKKPEPKVDETNEDEADADTEEEVNPYAAIALEMVNQGIFEGVAGENGTIIAPEVTTPEQLLEHFQDSGRRIAADYLENYLNSRGAEARDIFDNIIGNGVDPKEYLNRYAKIKDFKTLNIQDEVVQEQLVRELYRSEGRSPEYVDKKIAQYKQNSDLELEAEEAQRILISREEEAGKTAAVAAKAEQERKAEIKRSYEANMARILNEKSRAKDFDGIPVTREVAQETYGYMTEGRYKLKGDDSKLLTEFEKDIMELERPANHEMKVKLGLLFQMLKKDPKLTGLSKKAVSNENNALFSGLKKRNMKAGVGTKDASPGTKADGSQKSWFNK